MKKAIYVAALFLVARAAIAQSTTSSPEVSNHEFRSTSTLVIVPTLIRSDSGELVTSLDASHFRLTDNGIEQKVSVEQAGDQPIALVVVMQTGGAASGQLQSYSRLDTMLDTMVGSSTRKVALVTFDGHVQQIWAFPPRVDALNYFMTHPEAGDHGAAILDAVKCAIGLLQLQPANFRRVIVLLSQARDDGSETPSEDVVRGLAESGTTIYSLTFSSEGSGLNGRFTKSQPRNPLDKTSPATRLLSDPFRLSTSPGSALNSIRGNTTVEMANLSGGEHAGFHDEHDLETRLSSLADVIHNGYSLSFYPSSHESGFHAITVQVVKEPTPLEVTARRLYWFDGTTLEK